MNRQRHKEELLGPYVLGVLDAEELRRVEEHMSGCVQCREEVAALREMEAALGEVPDEAFFDGPPQGGDLLLQRTLREMRGERDRAQPARPGNRRAGRGGLTGRRVLGRYADGGGRSGCGGPASAAFRDGVGGPLARPRDQEPLGDRSGHGHADDRTDDSRHEVGTGARRGHRAATGRAVPAGRRRQGRYALHRRSWVVGSAENGEGKGASLDGSAAVAPADVKAIMVENEAGRAFVSVPV